MHIVERGEGPPLVIVPGIQGRWEWIHDAVDALAEHYRVLTFSLADEPTAAFSATRGGIDGFADQIDEALRSRGISQTALCGISFGGLVALRYAARSPQRVSALVLVSAPGPRWHMRPRHEFFSRFPLIFGPPFLVEAALRMKRELAPAIPRLRDKGRFLVSYIGTALRAPGSPARMAARARVISSYDRIADCTAIACPTLVVHGEPQLDHVVNVGGTQEYVGAITGATVATFERTGHLGFATRPREFARIIQQFLQPLTQGSHDSAA